MDMSAGNKQLCNVDENCIRDEFLNVLYIQWIEIVFWVKIFSEAC